MWKYRRMRLITRQYGINIDIIGRLLPLAASLCILAQSCNAMQEFNTLFARSPQTWLYRLCACIEVHVCNGFHASLLIFSQ